MTDREKLLETMRRNLRRIAPQLEREGWSEADIAEISETVRGHLAADNGAGLEAQAKWLADRAWTLLEEERKALAAARAREGAVVFGPKQEAETREMNRTWSRLNSK